MKHNGINKNYSFGGRIRNDKDTQHHEWGQLKFERSAAVYKRFSTYEQVQTSRFSVKRQDRLEQLAIDHGYKAALTPEEIAEFQAQSDYPGYYWNGNIVVIESDLGISGTKGQENRPGLAYLIELIETNQIESIYVVDVTRLFRDSGLITAPAFAHLCKQYSIILLTEGMRLDMRNEMHYNFFLQLAQYAGMELKTLRERLGKARELKANDGLYAGGNIATGFYVDLNKNSATFEQFLEYPPHADIIREIFEIALAEDVSAVKILRECRRRNLYFPLFEPKVAAWMNSRSGLRLCDFMEDQDGNIIGYKISQSLIRSILTNPAYPGLPVRNGHILDEGDHPVIVDPSLFAMVYEKLETKKPKRRGKIKDTEPQLLQGILFSDCPNFTEEQVVHFCTPSSPPHQTYLRCSCYREYFEEGMCSCVDYRVISEPVRDHVLKQISFPEVSKEIQRTLEADYNQSKDRAKAYQRERQRLQSEIDTIRHNYTHLKLEGEAAKLMEQDIERRLSELRMLEAKEMQTYSHQMTVNEDEIKFITEFLKDMRSQWANVPQLFQNRLFQLILEKVVMKPDGEDFFVDIYWKTGPVDTLWVERPLRCVPGRRTWSEAEVEILRKHFPSSPIATVLSLLPGRSRDTIQARAAKLGLSRNIREDLNWSQEEDEILESFSRKEITYKQMRRALLHRRQKDVVVRIKKLGLKMPKRDHINWHLVNCPDNQAYRPK